MEARHYQIEAKLSTYDALRLHRCVLVVMPTGTGKTVTFASIIADAIRAGRRVLVLAHREELLDQAAAKISAMAGCPVAVEQAGRAEATPASPVVVGSVMSMIRRLTRFPSSSFDLVIVDEAHHSLAATYQELLAHFSSAKVIGFTATANRGDDKALGQVFGAVAFDMTLGDAIHEGWLVPVRTKTIELESLDLSKVRRRSGELAAGDLEQVMTEVAVLREAVEPAIEIAGSRQAIVFCVTRAHMHCVAETIRQIAEERMLDLPIATVDGTTPGPQREAIMAGFRDRTIRWIVNVEVATEGFDAPATEVIIGLRPTLSRALYLQMGGRATRPLAGIVDGLYTAAERRAAIAKSTKTHCLWLDFAGNAGKHDIASAMDLLGGDFDPVERREAERLVEAGEADDLFSALELARARRAAQLAEVLARAGDPFALFGLAPLTDRWGRSMTPKQEAVLAQLRCPRRMDRREANVLLEELARRNDLGLCLYSQAALLARLGHPIPPIRELGKSAAATLIRELARNNWRPPAVWP